MWKRREFITLLGGAAVMHSAARPIWGRLGLAPFLAGKLIAVNERRTVFGGRISNANHVERICGCWRAHDRGVETARALPDTAGFGCVIAAGASYRRLSVANLAEFAASSVRY